MCGPVICAGIVKDQHTTLGKDECIRWLMNMLPNAFVQTSEPTSTTACTHTPDSGVPPIFLFIGPQRRCSSRQRVQNRLSQLRFYPQIQELPQALDLLRVKPLPTLGDRLLALEDRQRLPPTLVLLLDSDPSNSDHDIHALLLRSLPLVAVRSILVVVPVCAHGAVHAAAPVLLRLAWRPNVLDNCAVGDVLVAGLCGLGALGLDCCGFDEGFEDGLLGWC
jgi:hypothetical protein